MEIPVNKKVKLSEVFPPKTDEKDSLRGEKIENTENNEENNKENKEDKKSPNRNNEEKTGFFSGILSILFNVIVLIGILAFIRTFIFLPFNVDGPSMESTLHNKEFIYVDRLMPRFFGYNYGDVIVFYPPSQHGRIKKVEETGLICYLDIVKNYLFFQGKESPCNVPASYVKRIIALPGDNVEVKNGHVFVTKKGEETPIQVSEEFLMDNNKNRTSVPASIRKFQLISEKGKNFGKVPEGKYFVLGDNRRNSSDSRAESWDNPFVEHDNITGIVRAVYLSPVPVPAQESRWDTIWASITSIPLSFSGIRIIGDENILGK